MTPAPATAHRIKRNLTDATGRAMDIYYKKTHKPAPSPAVSQSRHHQTQPNTLKPSPKPHQSPIPTPTTPQQNPPRYPRVKAFPTAEAHRRETPGHTL
mgnify:CR=1 FL=1